MTEENNPTLKRFEKTLEQIRRGLSVMEKCGVDEELLEAWLQVKTKMSKKDVKLMIASTKEFYSKLIAKEMCKGLEE